jgi:GT2 family glycosyltransferase
MSPGVLVSIVTYNSARYLRHCLDSLKSQTLRDVRIILHDNASTDSSLDIAAEYSGFLDEIRSSSQNMGFCAAHNRVIASADFDYVLVLNPDVVLERDFIAILAEALDRDSEAGAATGRLWRLDPDGDSPLVAPRRPRILDSTGIYFTPAQRHFDRGSGETDAGQFQRREYVFGASGAAAFYRRKMLEAVKTGHEFFDEDFFAYREDADLAWRAQWMGWKCLYVPEAGAYHVRRVLPERRARLPREINMHSFKNRFLMRIKNMDAGTYARFCLPITIRDLGALAYVLVREPSSLRAFPLLLGALPRAWAARKALRRHRRVTASNMRSWFAYSPVARPADFRKQP